jgi:hypothetical protein
MLKELRDLVTFILGLVSDMREMTTNSVLPVSPSMTLGTVKARALHLTAVVWLVVLSIFVYTGTDAPSRVDVLVFALTCTIYIIIAAFVIELAIRYFTRTTLAVAGVPNGEADDSNDKAFNVVTDSHSYVLNFNFVALFLFAVTREIIVYEQWTNDIGLVNLIAAILSAFLASVVLLSFRPKRAAFAPSKITRGQRLGLCLVLSALFLAYSQLIVR